MALSEEAVDIVAAEDEARFRDLMQAHHYLGAVPGMGETIRYVAHHHGRCLALLVFSAPALKCRARDRWIGWDSVVNCKALTAAMIDSRYFIAARRRAETEVMLPPGPKIAFFTGGVDCNNQALSQGLYVGLLQELERRFGDPVIHGSTYGCVATRYRL